MIELQDMRAAAESVLATMEGAPEVLTAVTGEPAAPAAMRETWAASEHAASGSRSGGLFLVDVKVHGDEIEVFIDSDRRGADGHPRPVTIDDCVLLTKAIEERFDREDEDFSLTVSSAGIGQPLRVERQYRKLAGLPVEVLLGSGAKLVAILEAFENGELTLTYEQRQRAEGKKRPETVKLTRTLPLTEIKTTKEYIDFK